MSANTSVPAAQYAYTRVWEVYNSLRPKPDDLISPARFFVREGELHMWDEKKKKKKKRYFFLFNDILLLCRKEHKRYWLRIHITLRSPYVTIEEIENSSYNNEFRLHCRTRSFILYAISPDLRKEWVQDIQKSIAGTHSEEKKNATGTEEKKEDIQRRKSIRKEKKLEKKETKATKKDSDSDSSEDSPPSDEEEEKPEQKVETKVKAKPTASTPGEKPKRTKTKKNPNDNSLNFDPFSTAPGTTQALQQQQNWGGGMNMGVGMNPSLGLMPSLSVGMNPGMNAGVGMNAGMGMNAGVGMNAGMGMNAGVGIGAGIGGMNTGMNTGMNSGLNMNVGIGGPFGSTGLGQASFGTNPSLPQQNPFANALVPTQQSVNPFFTPASGGLGGGMSGGLGGGASNPFGGGFTQNTTSNPFQSGGGGGLGGGTSNPFGGGFGQGTASTGVSSNPFGNQQPNTSNPFMAGQNTGFSTGNPLF